MPLAKTKAIALFGLSGTLIDVEADISSNLPNFILVGLPDASLSESTSRVRAACLAGSPDYSQSLSSCRA
jgi:magnesium chelatase family protein